MCFCLIIPFLISIFFINKREKKCSKHEPLLWLAHRTLLVKSEDAVKHINRIDFLFHHHIGIDFRGVDVGMPQHLTCGVDVTSGCQDEGGEGVTAAMEGNGFVYSCFSCHTLQGTVGIAEKGDVCEHPVIK